MFNGGSKALLGLVDVNWAFGAAFDSGGLPRGDARMELDFALAVDAVAMRLDSILSATGVLC